MPPRAPNTSPIRGKVTSAPMRAVSMFSLATKPEIVRKWVRYPAPPPR